MDTGKWACVQLQLLRLLTVEDSQFCRLLRLLTVEDSQFCSCKNPRWNATEQFRSRFYAHSPWHFVVMRLVQ